MNSEFALEAAKSRYGDLVLPSIIDIVSIFTEARGVRLCDCLCFKDDVNYLCDNCFEDRFYFIFILLRFNLSPLYFFLWYFIWVSILLYMHRLRYRVLHKTMSNLFFLE